MNNSIYIQMCAIVYCILLVIIYFSKKQFKSFENKIYGYLIIINLLGLIVDISLGITSSHFDKYQLLVTVLTKLYLVYFVTWISFFTYYVMIISSLKKENSNKIYLNEKSKGINKKSLYLVYIIAIIVIYLLPVEFSKSTTGMHSYGLSTTLAYILSGVGIFVCIFVMLKHLKKEQLKKYSPVFIFLSLGTVIAVIQFANPTLILIPAMETFVTFLMYFTIENPDVKLLEEVHKSKAISDNANEEKTLFLFNISQEIKNTTMKINESADNILDSDSLDYDKDNARDIKSTTSNLISSTNGLFDVSQIDSSNIKIYNSKYNIKLLLKELITKYEPIIKNKGLELRTNIEHNLPETLYGDSISLKEIISTIFEKNLKYTSKGYIELNINTIIKNDVCRLIITMEDSGAGIKSDDLNKVLSGENDLSKANKTTVLMNGTMLITSDFGRGTKVKIMLDQKIEVKELDEVKKYDTLYDNKKILLVNSSEAGNKIVEKLLKNSNIELLICKSGKECIDKIRSKEKYDLILLDENQESLTKEEIVKKLNSITNFNTKIILLTKDNSYEYNDELKESGFDDYLLKPLTKDNFLSKIDKYLKKDN